MLTDEYWQAEALINYSITEEKVRNPLGQVRFRMLSRFAHVQNFGLDKDRCAH